MLLKNPWVMNFLCSLLSYLVIKHGRGCKTEETGEVQTTVAKFDRQPLWGKIMADQRWNLAKDMNHDGQFTISDISHMAEYAFFLPGDGLIFLLLDTDMGNFLEISVASYGGWGSGIISGLAWLVVCGLANMD